MRGSSVESYQLGMGKALVLVGEDSLGTKLPTSIHSLSMIDCTFEFPQGDVQNMHMLAELTIQHCSFDYIPSSIFQTMKLLCKLDMSQSGLSAIPKDICGLSMLLELRVDGNALTELPRELRQLSRLQVLSARENRLSLSTCTFPAQLKRLFISGNAVMVIPELPASVEVLCAARNEIMEVGSLVSLKKLRCLDLRKNKISSWPDFRELPLLNTLLIAGNAGEAPSEWTAAAFPRGILFDVKSLDIKPPDIEKKKRYRCKLLLVRWNVKGIPTCTVLKPVGSQITLGNCFVVIGKESVYVYFGPKARNFDIAACVSVASKIADDSQRKVLFFNSLSEKGRSAFWRLLRCDTPPEPSVKIHESCSTHAEYLLRHGSLTRVAAGATELISEGPLTRSMMKSTEAYLLRTHSELYLWFGSELSSDDREAALAVRNTAISDLKRKHSMIGTFEEDQEDTLFRSRFESWPQSSVMFSKEAHLQSKSPHKQQLLSERVLSTEFQRILDDGTTESVPGELYGVLFSDQADTFCMENVGNKIAQTIADRVSSIAQTKTSVVLQRQFKEHPIFVSALSGLSVCEGLSEEENDEVRLFQVRPFADSYRAFQVECLASSLSSRDTFLLIVPESLTAFTWVGKGSDEVNIAHCKREAVRLLGPKSKEFLVKEGEETDGFWDAIGGKLPYSENVDTNVSMSLTSLHHQTVFTHYVPNFSQYDLDPSCIAIITVGDTKWRWVGPLAPEFLRQNHDDESVVDVPFGEEPLDFKAVFPGWCSIRPDGPTKAEKALSNEEFEWRFKCDRKRFYSLPNPLVQAMRWTGN